MISDDLVSFKDVFVRASYKMLLSAQTSHLAVNTASSAILFAKAFWKWFVGYFHYY